MSDNTKIEWTEATWNPVTGCSVTSPGCTNCYAMKLAGTRLAHHESRAGLTRDSKAGPVWTGEVRFNEQWLDQPLRWRRPRMIFVCAHGDLFHEDVTDEWIDRVFAVMALCPQHTFQVLTKRSARMREYLTHVAEWADNIGREAARIWGGNDPDGIWEDAYSAIQRGPLPNVWLGVSVEDQVRADERIPDLLATPAAVRWLSCEPLLGTVRLDRLDDPADHSFYIDALAGEAWDDVNGGLNNEIWGADEGPKLDWIVAGGESGPGARPMHPDWARSLRDQCAAAGVPFFFKQWGAWGHGEQVGEDNEALMRAQRDYVHRGHLSKVHVFPDGIQVGLLGKKRAGRLLDGVTHDAMPERAA